MVMQIFLEETMLDVLVGSLFNQVLLRQIH